MPRLVLSPAGKYLAVVDDRIRVVEHDQQLVGEDCVAFDGAVWVRDASMVRRYTPAGRETGSVEVPGSGRLVRVPYGAPAAVLAGTTGAVLVREQAAELVVEPLAVDLTGDALAPLSTHRFVRARGSEIAVVDGVGTRWTFDAGAHLRMMALAPLFEGRSIAAVLGRVAPGEQQLLVLDARDGRVQHRLVLRCVGVTRFTALRGLAVVCADRQHVILVDLRFGKVIRQHREDRPIVDLAIDDTGQRIAMLFDDGTITDAAVADLGRTSVPAPLESFAVASREEPELPPEPEPEPVPDQREEVPSPPPASLVVPVLHALQPLGDTPTCHPDELARWLAGVRTLIAAATARAIAAGWDSGAIGFVDETRPPFETEVASIVLGMRGLADLQLRKTDEAMAAARQAVSAIEAGLAAESPLARLAREHDLDELDRRLLIYIAAPSLWGELARLYGILANDASRALCDEQLLVQLCGAEHRDAIARALDRDRPLVRAGLVHVTEERARPFAALTIDSVVLRILRGHPIDTDLDEHVELAPAAPPLADLRVPRAALARALARLADRSAQPVRLVVRGRTGSGRRTVATALAAHAGRRIGVVDARPDLRARRFDRLAALLRRTALRGWLPLVDGLEHATDDLRMGALDVVRNHPGPLAIRLPHDATLRIPDALALELDPLTIGERADHWRSRSVSPAEADALAARFQVGPGLVDRCLAQRADGEPIEKAMRRQLASQLGEVATRVDRLPTWSQIVLPDDIEDSVLELIARIRYARTVYDAWGFDDIVTSARGVTALFQGPPGTGKTLVAGAIANELGLDLYRIDLSRVVSKWIGETEQNLAKVFAAAEESQAILLFDEADSLFSKRTEVKSSNDRHANTEVNYLLQRLDSFEGIAILTTNFGTSIDAAFKRRLSFRLTFPFPDDETRERLWKAHLPPRLPRAGTLDLGELSRRFRMSGGYIRNAALRAAFLAAEERSPLTQGHLERAIRAEFREIGNLADTGVLA